MLVELDAFLSVSTLMLLIKSKSAEKSEAKVIKPSQNKIHKQTVIKYSDPHPDIIVAAPCVYKYKINTVQGRIPETNVMLVYICVSVVLTWPHSRKEGEKLDITLDSTVFVFRV